MSDGFRISGRVIDPPVSHSDPSELSTDRQLAVLLTGWRDQAHGWLTAHLAGPRGLILAGSLTAVIYFIITMAFPITFWYSHTNDNLGTIPAKAPWGRIFLALGGPKPLNIWMGVVTLGVILALFGLQGLALFAAAQVSDAKRLRRLIFAFAVLFVVILVWMQPITSTDLYGYLARSYLIADLHQNPTVNQALFLPGGFQVPKARPPAPYGPLWLEICGAIGLLAGENLLFAMLLMKCLMAIATIGAIGLVMWLVDRLLPGQRMHATLFFAWSPLLLLEAVGNGHNDIVMMVMVLGSLAVIVARRPVLAFPLLALGVLIKYSVGALVPLWVVTLLFLFCWRGASGQSHLPTLPLTWRGVHRWLSGFDLGRVIWIFGGGGALALGTAILCYAPFWVGLKTFTGLGQQLGATYFNGSLAGMFFAATNWTVAGAQSASLGSAVRLLLYGIYILYVLWQAWHLALRGPGVTVIMLAQMSGKVIFATLVLVTFWFQPWYIVWLLPLAALAPDAILRRHAATLAFGGAATYIVQYFMFVKQVALTRDFFVQFFLVIVAFVPLLVLRHGGAKVSLPQRARNVLESIGAFSARRPIFINRVLLSGILIVAALLRLIHLGTVPGSPLRQVSGTLKLSVLDTRGLDGPFGILQTLAVAIFGPTTFALLLPTAILGTITVGVIYALTAELFVERYPGRHETLGLIAALFAATAQWHVALSRSGVHVVVLPLLLSLALLALWRTRHLRQTWGYHVAAQPEEATTTKSPTHPLMLKKYLSADHLEIALLIFAGLCMGLVADLEPGLWLIPLIMLAVVVAIWRRQRLGDGRASRFLGILVVATGVSMIPFLWHFLARGVGFAPGSPVLARSAWFGHTASTPSFGQLLAGLGNVAKVVITQNYGATGPSAGNVPILPALTFPFVVLGLILLLQQWRRLESLVLFVLASVPFLAVVALAPPPPTVVAATILPVACILPALGLETVGYWLATIPEILSGSNRVFIARQNIVRVGLSLLLAITAVSTFFWYFVATVPGPTLQAIP